MLIPNFVPMSYKLGNGKEFVQLLKLLDKN